MLTLKYNMRSIAKLFFVFLTVAGPACYSQMNKDILKYYKGGEKVFPPEWLSGKIQVKATVPIWERNNTFNEMDKGLWKYPTRFNGYLSAIYLVGHLSFSGFRTAGAHTDDKIYLATRHNNDLEKDFHAEFAAILLKKNSSIFKKEDWVKLSFPMKMHISSYNSSNIRSPRQLNTVLFREGYLTNYSLISLENDFSMYAGNLFAGGKKFWYIVDHNELIRQKTQLIIKFYHSLNPTYTENWFRFISEFRLF